MANASTQLEPKSATFGSVWRFGQLSCVSFLLNLGVTIALHEWIGLSTTLAYAIGIAIVFVVNFVVMRCYVFPTNATDSLPIVKQATGFLASSIFFRSLEYVAFYVIHVLGGWYYVVTILLITCTSFLAKFVLCQRWLFGSATKQLPKLR